MKVYTLGILIILCSTLIAQVPVVENVRFAQRTDGSLLVDIYFDLMDTDSDLLDIIIEASNDSGIYYFLPCWTYTGDAGRGITPGKDKHVVWDFFTDNPDISGDSFRIRVTAFDELSGSVIKDDLTLEQDLKGSPGGTDNTFVLAIGAPNVTLDLGGHTISGDVSHGISTGVGVGSYEGITVKNGTIENCLFGIEITESNNAIIENMIIRNLEISDPDTNVIGIVLWVSENIVIRDCLFEFLPIVHKEAVVNYHSYVTVDNIEVHGGAVGVNFTKEYTPRDNGSVLNSTFIGASLAAILNLYSSGVLIKNNEFSECELGITAQPESLGAVRGMIIEDNYFHDNTVGIYFTGVTESIISNNIVYNNPQWGIAMMPWGNDEGDFCATGNLIADNEVLGNGIDLIHDEQCVGNIWERNKFFSKQGSEIPEYTTTAREVITKVDSVAMSVAADGKLIFVTGGEVDTTGKTNYWTYVYESDSLQERYEVHVSNGQVRKWGEQTIVWLSSNMLPIPVQWMDSNSAVTVAENNGGKDFRETYSDTIIEMDLQKLLIDANEEKSMWNFRYMSDSSGETFNYEVIAE